jgi:hypothetical protein
MITEYRVTQAIHVAAALGIADLLAHGPRASDQLAESAGAIPMPSIGCCVRLRASASFARRTAVASRSRLSVNISVPLLAAYDFGRFGTAADIGGGNGALPSGLLQRYPQMQGVVF